MLYYTGYQLFFVSQFIIFQNCVIFFLEAGINGSLLIDQRIKVLGGKIIGSKTKYITKPSLLNNFPKKFYQIHWVMSNTFWEMSVCGIQGYKIFRQIQCRPNHLSNLQAIVFLPKRCSHIFAWNQISTDSYRLQKFLNQVFVRKSFIQTSDSQTFFARIPF